MMDEIQTNSPRAAEDSRRENAGGNNSGWTSQEGDGIGQSGSTTGGMKQVVDQGKEQIGDGIGKAQEQLDAGLEAASEPLSDMATKLREKAGTSDGVPQQAGVKVAEGMETAASYLKEHSSEEIMQDLEVFVKEHPLQALGGAVFAGFLFGRLIR